MIDSHTEMNAALEKLDARLGQSTWLSGDRFRLADISWIVNLFRLQQCQYDFSPFPKLGQWTANVVARPSFVKAVAEYQ